MPFAWPTPSRGAPRGWLLSPALKDTSAPGKVPIFQNAELPRKMDALVKGVASIDNEGSQNGIHTKLYPITVKTRCGKLDRASSRPTKMSNNGATFGSVR
jgi:hypothetical protein